MTREEAIRVLEEFQVIDDWTMVHLPPMEDAVNMAIEALRNCSEIPTGSDLISRQDAVEALEQEIDNATPINGDLDSADGHYRYALRLAKNIIKSLPSADIEEDIARRIATIIENEQDMRVILKNADPKTGWIPVSEKPKDEERTYLVQLDGGGMCSCRWTNANPIWTELTTDWHWNIFDIPQYCKVVAWMDLEPYREDGEV